MGSGAEAREREMTGNATRAARLVGLLSIFCTFFFASGCSGVFYVEASCSSDDNCPADLVCKQGTCVPQDSLTKGCGPLAPAGECTPTEVCADGVCYINGTQPPACSATSDGYCAGELACAAGVCQPIPPEDACSLQNPTGLCPSQQVCIEGWCYEDPPACSQTQPAGYCPSGQSCVNGACINTGTSCSPLIPQGTCPAWQTCVEGACTGPIPQDACSPSTPSGRCPADEVCVGGSCVPIIAGNACSADNPNGLCPAAAACVDGRCVAITSDNGCSPSNPGGLCPGGATCNAGACVQTACGAGGWLCDTGLVCDGQSCVVHDCDPVHPQGTCPASAPICEQGVCLPPTCSPSEPTGRCPFGLVCRDGQCDTPDCSPDVPDGYCPNGQVCESGICVEGPCAPDNLDGVCSGSLGVPHPIDGVVALATTCCDDALATATSCSLGTCAAPACTATEPRGACPPGDYCNDGTCETAPCGPYFQNGTCPANQQCSFGRCLLSGCSSQTDPNAYCAPGVCNTTIDLCVTPPCSLQYPNGYCAVGQACIGGICSVPDCSTQYPGGRCPSGKLCVGGGCIDPPCSPTYTSGACGPNYVCNNGICERAVCSLNAPLGSCPSGERCASGTCATYQCSSTFPNGPCPVGTICQNKSCITPTCSSSYPGGACNSGQVCSGGVCVDQPCSSTYASGACGAGFTCTAGVCTPAACGPGVPNGTCTGADAGKVCFSEQCVVYTCGANFPSGPCPVGDVCVTTTSPPSCQLPLCDTTYIGGYCPSPQVCAGGVCLTPACSPAVPTGLCPASQVCCDPGLAASLGCTEGTCILDACSPSAPDGSCAAGETCCNQTLIDGGVCSSLGSCVATSCSSQFPLGACSGPDAGKLCVGGTCVDPCSSTARQGWCPASFACVEGACSTACTNDADCDGISDSDEGTVDTDGDGSPDAFDRDSDGDGIPDAVEAGDLDISTPPVDTDNDGTPDFRDFDSDGDHISDVFEAGPAPAVPRDSDGDGTPDYLDTDSDGDGVLDACEVADGTSGLCSAVGIVDFPSGPTGPSDPTAVLDSDGDGLPDYLDTDSDADGISDTIEARLRPADASSFSSTGVDHDNDGLPDYRDPDSDGDGVADADEDTNGDGIVNCQVDGQGAVVLDPRATPACGDQVSYPSGPFSPSYAYDYNPGCVATGEKCMLAESSRVHPDSDGDGIADGQDGVFLVCSTANLKPINVFYSQAADYALALERRYTAVEGLLRGAAEAGMTFDDPSNSDGSWAVSGFILERQPSSTALATSNADPVRELIDKALAQELDDRALLASVTSVSGISLVINRNFTSFDGYGVVVSRYTVTTSAPITTGRLRDELGKALDTTVTGYANIDRGPQSDTFTFITETLYRFGDLVSGNGRVLVTAALVPTGTNSNDAQTYGYRTRCTAQPDAGTCGVRTGCIWSGRCTEDPAYQLPLFYADNITNGSAVAQYGDDLGALCQTMLQQNSILDFLWVVDNSPSMTEEIGQVQTSAELFVGILNNTEADYRIAQTTTAENRSQWEPQWDFSAYTTDELYRRNGTLRGGFTGAIAGRVDASLVDRSVTYTCADGCDNGAGGCCSLCSGGTTTVDDPACYFASRLPSANGSGAEFGLLMGEWAIYASGVEPLCQTASDATHCNKLSGCSWDGSMCLPNFCALPNCAAASTVDVCAIMPGCYWTGSACVLGIDDHNPEDECNGNDTFGTSQVPYGGDNIEDELEPANCAWNPLANGGAGACMPAVGEPCSRRTSQSSCTSRSPRCMWDSNSSTCYTDPTFGAVLCSADNLTDCQNQGGGWCEWDATGYCRPPLEYAFRPSASKVAVVLSDEEECYLKDHNFNGDCEWGGYGANITPYDHPIRLARENAYLSYYRSRGFQVFGIVGDKENRSISPANGNGGCNVGGNEAEAGAGYIKIAEGTGGGWGSICSSDLYPTIESIVIGALGRASPYKLEGFIGNTSVQPISSTIKVAVQACKVEGEYYLGCPSGIEMKVVPRSRDSGWDYDGINNTLILYGDARPIPGGEIVVSYRYWIDRPQPPEGNTSCPCPEAPTPDCLCPSGQACGIDASGNHCTVASLQADCEAIAGCAWNTALGCMVSGLCEPDPTCGGGCGTGEVCDPQIGLCVCDAGCGGSCGAGEVCDNNANINPCQGLGQNDCDTTAGCGYDAVLAACYSVTCGQCLCDTSCGGGCPAGQLCNSSAGPGCGECSCDISCGGGCLQGEQCNKDPSSPSCGLCQPRQCGACDAGTICDPATGLCVCDTSCSGGCPVGTYCDVDTGSGTCGQCLCDTSCGGGCPTGQTCDARPSSATCGLCQADPTCGQVGGNCNTDCSTGDTEGTCSALSGCRWAAWMPAGSQCQPIACELCNPTLGLCVADPNCCGACGPTETCNPTTGICACDTNCGFACAPGLSCNSSPSSPTCGLCLCDTSCGGGCPNGLVCDDNASCVGNTDEPSCTATSGCSWDLATQSCLSIFCGRCIVDPTCGGCATGETCDPTTGLCVPECPPCTSGQVCDPLSGTCICDTTCGGGCPIGSVCDDSTSSSSCGQCVCDTTCGGGCPNCQACDSTPSSPTCGRCLVDSTCGGGCSGAQVCDPLSGCCVSDPACGGFCPTDYVCDPLTGTCVYYDPGG